MYLRLPLLSSQCTYFLFRNYLGIWRATFFLRAFCLALACEVVTSTTDVAVQNTPSEAYCEDDTSGDGEIRRQQVWDNIFYYGSLNSELPALRLGVILFNSHLCSCAEAIDAKGHHKVNCKNGAVYRGASRNAVNDVRAHHSHSSAWNGRPSRARAPTFI